MYKIGDEVEVIKNLTNHGFEIGSKVTVRAIGAPVSVGSIISTEQYKCDQDTRGRKSSWWLVKEELVKRRK